MVNPFLAFPGRGDTPVTGPPSPTCMCLPVDHFNRLANCFTVWLMGRPVQMGPHS